MSRIAEEALQEIRDRVDLVELVGETVALKRRGKNYVGLCPFHREKTPSFNVNSERQIFKCFGCGAGGNALTFVMARDGVEFPDAARRLAARAGIDLPTDAADARPRWQPLYEANAFAAEFYARTLREAPEAAAARAYLTRRDVGDEAAASFRLGWAPPAWDALLGAARAAGLDERVLGEAGLVSRSERTGGLYDRFRARIVFPIQDAAGRVVGFSGRTIDGGEDGPKYLNSPETPVFRKGSLLFGLALSKNAIRRAEEAIVVEGNFDLLSLYARGLSNVVAPLGTALTEEQAQLLKRYAPRAVLLYDSDEAGLKAAFRSGDELVARGFTVRVAFLPVGSDPDAFIRDAGPDALRALLREAPDLIAAKLGVLRERLDLSRVDAKRRAIDLLLRSIRRIPDPITRELQIAFLADELRVDPALLSAASRAPQRRGPPRGRSREAPGPEPAAGVRPPPKVPSAEKTALLVLVHRRQLSAIAQSHVSADDFTVPASRAVYLRLLEDPEGEGNDASLLDGLSAESQSLLAELLLGEDSIEDAERMLTDSIVRMKQSAKERELAEARERGDLDDAWRLAQDRIGMGSLSRPGR